MPPRRSHKKSRAGCRRCKTRKIKCDEVHPRCSNCLKHGVLCDFENSEIADEFLSVPSILGPKPESPGPFTPATPATETTYDFASPLPPQPATPVVTHTQLCRPPPAPIFSSTTPATSRLLELKLLHHFTTGTSRTLAFSAPGTELIWEEMVPPIAFASSTHLTDAILAVSALHLRTLAPGDQELVRASHAYMASSLRAYSETLTQGINASNAEALFLTATFIAFQSTATRIFTKDEPHLGHGDDYDGYGTGYGSLIRNPRSLSRGGYTLPLSWFHAFQGVKAVTAASWPFLRSSNAAIPIIESQAVLHLDFSPPNGTFFGHLLDGLDEELAALPAPLTPTGANATDSTSSAFFPPSVSPRSSQTLADSTKQAYQHAVAVLNWAHRMPQRAAPLAFPATVSRRYVELLEERRPRALAILAGFFALLKSLDATCWWLHGMARREVMGVVTLFNNNVLFDDQVEREWLPHLEWAVKVAMFDDRACPGYVPPEVWGGTWMDGSDVGEVGTRGSETFVSHIEMLTRMAPPFDEVTNSDESIIADLMKGKQRGGDNGASSAAQSPGQSQAQAQGQADFTKVDATMEAELGYQSVHLD